MSLVELAGERRITGGNNLATGFVDQIRNEQRDEIVARLVEMGFAHAAQVSPLESAVYTMDRLSYTGILMFARSSVCNACQKRMVLRLAIA